MMLPHVKLPIFELAGQKPAFDTGALDRLQSISEHKKHPILKYDNNPEFWCQLLRFGFSQQWLSDECINNAINGSNTLEAQSCFLSGLESHLNHFKDKVQSRLNRPDFPRHK